MHLPNDVERSIFAAVENGRFASIDEAMAWAASLLLRELGQPQPASLSGQADTEPSLGSIGAMRDAAAELDEVVADAYRRRREETWRELDLE